MYGIVSTRRNRVQVRGRVRAKSRAGFSAVLAMLLAVGATVAANRAGAEAPGDAELAEASIRSQALVGLRAPACELTRLSAGSSADSSAGVEGASFVKSFEGRVVLVDFWASWCPTCERAFGFLNQLTRDYRDAGLEVIAVNLDTDPREVRDFLAGRRIEFELARDATGRCPRGFGLIGMPSAYLIDDSGHVRAVTRGFRPGEARALRAQIDALLAKSPSPLPTAAGALPVEESASEQHATDSTHSSAR